MSGGFTDFGSLCCASLSDFFMIVHTGSMGPGCGMAAKGRGEFWAFRDLRGQKKKKKGFHHWLLCGSTLKGRGNVHIFGCVI